MFCRCTGLCSCSTGFAGCGTKGRWGRGGGGKTSPKTPPRTVGYLHLVSSPVVGNVQCLAAPGSLVGKSERETRERPLAVTFGGQRPLGVDRDGWERTEAVGADQPCHPPQKRGGRRSFKRMTFRIPQDTPNGCTRRVLLVNGRNATQCRPRTAANARACGTKQLVPLHHPPELDRGFQRAHVVTWSRREAQGHIQTQRLASGAMPSPLLKTARERGALTYTVQMVGFMACTGVYGAEGGITPTPVSVRCGPSSASHRHRQ